MRFSKFIKVSVILLLGFTVIWYFFIKDFNYQITFKTDKAPGIVYNQILSWNNNQSYNKKAVKTLNKNPFSDIEQQVIIGDTILIIKWELEKYDDKITLVTAKIKDVEHSLIQNIQVLYKNNIFVKESIKAVQDVKNSIVEDSKKYIVSAVLESETPASHCVCTSMKSTVNERALQMINQSILPLQYIRTNNLKIVDHPFLQVTSWNRMNDTIIFDFCFPIEKQDKYPEDRSIVIKDVVSRKALKATFYGNYGISDRAWFSIIDYANINNINLDLKPIEIFKNDPHDGGDELKWEAEVYIPYKE